MFANNKELAISLLRAAGTGDNLLATLDVIAEDVQAEHTEKADA